MTNTSQENQPSQEECKICETYNLFTHYVKSEIPVEEAFYHAVAKLYEDTVHDVADFISALDDTDEEEAHFQGYREGYSAALRTVAEQTMNTAIRLEEEFEDDCTCEECRLEDEYDKCFDCDCEDECEVDIAKEIRRAIWEDED